MVGFLMLRVCGCYGRRTSRVSALKSYLWVAAGDRDPAAFSRLLLGWIIEGGLPSSR
jgi:hypothetical protein